MRSSNGQKVSVLTKCAPEALSSNVPQSTQTNAENQENGNVGLKKRVSRIFYLEPL